MEEDSLKTKNNDLDTNEEERLALIEESKRRAFLWLFVGILFFLVSIILSYLAYTVMTSPADGGANALRSLSMQLAGKDEGKDDLEGKKRRIIDGVYVEEGAENIYPLAVMIDNHADAQPPAGLSKANLVFEAEAEGGMTRYMAVFADAQNIEKIGPVRSARAYYVDWSRELSALYAHVGGSPEALVNMKRDNVLHINEFYNGDYFWRDEQRPRPHNVFTSTENLRSYLKKKDLDQGTFLGWQFKDEETLENRGDITSITIPFRLKGYEVEWKYDSNNNEFTRFLSGTEHRDEDESLIKAKNVILQVVKAEEIDSELRLRMHDVGEGSALACFDGRCHEVAWKKVSETSRTRYYDEFDSELKLSAGTTWVEVLRPEIEYVVK